MKFDLSYGDTTGGKPPIRLAGQLSMVTYDPVEVTVHIVPVNEAAIPFSPSDAADLQQRMNAIYHPAVVNVTVEIEASLAAPEFSDTLLRVDRHPLSNYTRQMLGLRGLVKDQPYHNSRDYYLMVVKNMDPVTREGVMPRKRRYGFLNAASRAAGNPAGFARLAAHELGHGAFHLQHTFDQFAQALEGSTDNLMDYGGGEGLYRYQWGEVHDPEGNFTLFDDGGEGESVFIRENYLCLPFTGTVDTFGNTYLDPEGSVIELGTNIYPVAFIAEHDSNYVRGAVAVIYNAITGAYYSFFPFDGGSAAYYRMRDENQLIFNDSLSVQVSSVYLPKLVISDTLCNYTITQGGKSISGQLLDCNCNFLSQGLESVSCDEPSNYDTIGVDDHTNLLTQPYLDSIELEIDTIESWRDWTVLVDVRPIYCRSANDYEISLVANDTIQLVFFIDVNYNDETSGLNVVINISDSLGRVIGPKYIEYIRNEVCYQTYSSEGVERAVLKTVRAFKKPQTGLPLYSFRITHPRNRITGTVSNVIGGLYGCRRRYSANDTTHLPRPCTVTHNVVIDGRNAALFRDKVHDGYDIYAPLNSPLFSMYDGTIEEAVWLVAPNVYRRNSFGNRIVVRHTAVQYGGVPGSQDVYVMYTHLNAFEQNITAGQRVTAGQKIGETGRTGNLAREHHNAYHTHIRVHLGSYGIRQSSSKVNPGPYFPVTFDALGNQN